MSSSSKRKNKITNILILFFLVLFISFRVSTACNQMKKNSSSDPDELSLIHPDSPYSELIVETKNKTARIRNKVIGSSV